LHLIEWNAKKLTGGSFNIQHTLGDLLQLTLQVSAALNGMPERQPQLSAQDTLEVARFRELPLQTWGADFEGVTAVLHQILVVEQLSQSLRDQFAIAVGNSARLVDVYAKQTGLSPSTQLHFNNFDWRIDSGPLTELGDPVDQSDFFRRYHSPARRP
jgi:hypothetical protein